MVRLAVIATGQAMVKPFIHADTHSTLNPPILIADIEPDINSAMVTDESKADTQNCFLLIFSLLIFNKLTVSYIGKFNKNEYISFINDRK